MQKSVIFFKQSLPEKVVTLLQMKHLITAKGRSRVLENLLIVCLLVVMRICMAVCN